MVKLTDYGSYLVGDLPEGCRLCTMGAKLVLFVTGLCNRKCFYCPLSPQRKGKDISLANERPIGTEKDIIEEGRLMDALGTGITGGDPLSVPERTLRFLSLVKTEFGREHHVHLYTAKTRISSHILTALKREGLDEIRFHATISHRDVMLKASDAGLRTGVEIPVIPGRFEEVKAVAKLADECGCEFLNLNELEMCETTAKDFHKRGLRLLSDESMAVAGSLGDAIRIARFCEDNTSLNVHVCPSRLKDAIQLRNRLGRIARNVKKPYELIDEDNLLVKTTVTVRCNPSEVTMKRLARHLRKELSIEPELLAYNPTKRRIETLPELAEKIADLVDKQKIEVALTEEYPSWDRLETEKWPVN